MAGLRYDIHGVGYTDNTQCQVLWRQEKKTAPPQDTNYDAVLNPATAEGL